MICTCATLSCAAELHSISKIPNCRMRFIGLRHSQSSPGLLEPELFRSMITPDPEVAGIRQSKTTTSSRSLASPGRQAKRPPPFPYWLEFFVMGAPIPSAQLRLF